MKKRLTVKHRARNYYAASRRSRRSARRWLYIGAIAALSAVLFFSGFMLIRYFGDYFSSRKAAEELRRINQAAMEAEQALQTPSPTALPVAAVPAATAAPTPTQGPSLVLPSMRYPTNYYAIVSSRFKKIQAQNKDIIGWLTIPEVIDEAVVQRDNEYYLRRDYRGYHNQNGAIFLDENCKLTTRPYTLMLYGHNMKTGAMFGSLRNYENSTFYHHNPFITFDTAYENGRYVVFAVGTISTVAGNGKYVNFAKLNSSTIPWRKEALEQLMKLSVYYTPIDVQPEDQLLLLMTCVDDTTERRVVVARRIRAGESEAALQTMVNRTILK